MSLSFCNTSHLSSAARLVMNQRFENPTEFSFRTLHIIEVIVIIHEGENFRTFSNKRAASLTPQTTAQDQPPHQHQKIDVHVWVFASNVAHDIKSKRFTVCCNLLVCLAPIHE